MDKHNTPEPPDATEPETEGHAYRIKATEDDSAEVEGHLVRVKATEDSEREVEGHVGRWSATDADGGKTW